MMLIAESEDESRIINRLSALLCDLGFDVDSYQYEEAIAVTFLSANQLSVLAETQCMNNDEKICFLRSVEDRMRSAMLRAGYQTMQTVLEKASIGLSHPDRHFV